MSRTGNADARHSPEWCRAGLKHTKLNGVRKFSPSVTVGLSRYPLPISCPLLRKAFQVVAWW